MQDPTSRETAVCDIGSRRELFVDRYLIDKLDGAALKLQEPRPGGIALRYDQPWESSIAFYTTVLHDDNVYRMYYRGSNISFPPTPRPPSATFYAESTDGINWTRPELGLLELRGTKRNNAILPDRPVYPFGPFIDAKPDVPSAERYKAVARHVGGPVRHLMGYVSIDGIHWRLLSEEPIVPATLENNFDSQNVAFWSEAEGCYVAYVRHMEEGRRSTARATSDDFVNWSPQTLMSYSDTGSTVPSQHLYTNQTQPYFRAPHIYIAMPARMHFGRRLLSAEEKRFYEMDMDPIAGGAGDTSDGVLLTSRAGATEYDCTFKDSFVRPGPDSANWTSRSNYPALGVVQTSPTEMSLYVHRQYGHRSAHLERMTLRLDGFASIHAAYSGGEVVTRPFTFDGRYLELNYATSAAGSIRLEIQDRSGTPIPGYALADCPYIIGDEIARLVGWDRQAVRESLPETGAPAQAMEDEGEAAYKEGPVLREAPSDLQHLAGTPIRLRFVLKDADLFSLRFS